MGANAAADVDMSRVAKPILVRTMISAASKGGLICANATANSASVGPTMHHHTAFHDPVLVALSILIAVLASYTALDLATRMRAASGRSRRAWLVAAAIAMGGGIWSMHFVGMLAFSMPGTAISYDPFLTLLSLIFPVVVAAAAFAVVGRRPQALLASGLAMGLGIAGMH